MYPYPKPLTLSAIDLCRVKIYFKPSRKEQMSVKDTGKKAKIHVILAWKFPWKSCSTTHLPFLSSNPKILKAFLKFFPSNWSLAKFPAKETRRGVGEKAKVKDCCVNFKATNYLEILLSQHAKTLKANTRRPRSV